MLTVPSRHNTAPLPVQVSLLHRLELSKIRGYLLVKLSYIENIELYIQTQVPVVLKIGLHAHV
jgi:hypothetical protein